MNMQILYLISSHPTSLWNVSSVHVQQRVHISTSYFQMFCDVTNYALSPASQNQIFGEHIEHLNFQQKN